MRSRIVLYAEEGMVLTDGEIYGKQIFLADGADPAAYREITQEAYETIQQEQEVSNEEIRH